MVAERSWMRLPAPRSIALLSDRSRVPWAMLSWAMGRGLVVRGGEVLTHADLFAAWQAEP